MFTKKIQVTPVRDYEAPLMLMYQISTESGFADSVTSQSIKEWQEDTDALSF